MNNEHYVSQSSPDHYLLDKSNLPVSVSFIYSEFCSVWSEGGTGFRSTTVCGRGGRGIIICFWFPISTKQLLKILKEFSTANEIQEEINTTIGEVESGGEMVK